MKRIFSLLLGLLCVSTHAYAVNGDLNVSGNITAASVSAPLNGNATTATSLVTSRGTITTNETGTYGNLQVSGNKNGYFGIRSSDFGRTFMFNASYSGIYKDSASWSWFFDDNGVLGAGTVPGARITGTVPDATNAAKATNAVNLNGQPASYYQAAATAINTGNIGSQSVSYAASAGSAASATNAGQLNSQPGSFYQNASNLNAGAVPATVATAGSVIGYASASTGSVVKCNVTIPRDDTVPQITEGTQVLSVIYAAKRPNSRIVIRAYVQGQPTNAGTTVSSLFQSGSSNAIAAATHTVSADGNFPAPIAIMGEYSPGSTDSVTYSLRVGRGDAGQVFYVNGTNAGLRVFGGVAATYMTVEEIAQ
ncbi:hypothetical protein KI809_11285 [Geobacter pelophilus]|uniref:Uncharacterized protein n=1 Tax=Geoanaerobacter pelophilus TaxID=60036 RepID=A0AAW4LA14_9BACT|nr:hypothetical protein [Geoanaerobacter pelophilus]MBT0664884.1 hypothetical protein [Geoanaerobacter pelophilus]